MGYSVRIELTRKCSGEKSMLTITSPQCVHNDFIYMFQSEILRGGFCAVTVFSVISCLDVIDFSSAVSITEKLTFASV